MKKHIQFFTLSFTLLFSNSTFAKGNSHLELVCDTEAKWSVEANKVYRDSLKSNFGDHYEHIGPRIEKMKIEASKLVQKNCLAGKHHKEISAEIDKIWAEGCKPVVNPSLHPVCMKFKALNDGSQVEKRLADSPALNEIFKRSKKADAVEDCAPGVSTESTIKDGMTSPVDSALSIQSSKQ